ncbi:glutamate dehydrogenase (NAD(P)+) [Streptoalloteichus tenebrarius]|uniref:Glutamate dehydrogenase n=1 Tax=Streptoalloteichus tenebrarius (strain ATCC 17920 / DSM 40477 / JCM 4838 / CBS 697.72 / NBRC 16177 / NCIMB 11028 / NRRL B-12390 / A12253. 1 / ISP 5477) TaxID=1933 RepID=A0ABT1HU47_STRSD|nr:Glu/Leu/Phe/Val dehydrogenase dimerization domain-containing protein [Streptoalloteichus tenebrarius]MCP2259046.1 glutamate dehydrogenase (NAD(P)+) [Streptoalloteichus tenebrarius]BFE99628.1 Glu/Leu/Phe/Val dehydrogenase dimerization domain-containing protein [Streptoalloteichus tenebrarius]
MTGPETRTDPSPGPVAPRALARRAEPYLTVTWTDDVTGARGHLVLDQVVGGVASGGLRMRPGCTLEEVVDLARTMTLKEALAYRPGDRYVPFGGGKGGIDFDPRHPEARAVLGRFLHAVRPMLERRWAFGEDLGVRQSTLDEIATEMGLRSTVDPALAHVPDGAEAGLDRLARAFAVDVGGVGLGDLVGGHGVATAALAALRHRGERPEGRTAVVQGFGSIGGAAARYLAEAGVLVVGIADERGLVVNQDGLDVEHLLRTRDAHGVLDRSALRAGDHELPRDAWLGLPADVLVTAAVSYAVDARNQADVVARYLVEGANVSVSAEAERALLDRGVVVVPDFVANCAANCWWWWTLFGDVEPTAESAFARIAETLGGLVDRVLTDAAARGVSPRRAAVDLAEHNLESLLRWEVDRAKTRVDRT